jgi:hypothetical protein
MSILLQFADGSVGTVNYFANGAKDYPKETLEIFTDGRVLRLAHSRIMRGHGLKGFRKCRTARQDKGHAEELASFIQLVERGGQPIIPFEQIKNITSASFAAVKSARERTVINL